MDDISGRFRSDSDFPDGTPIISRSFSVGEALRGGTGGNVPPALAQFRAQLNMTHRIDTVIESEEDGAQAESPLLRGNSAFSPMSGTPLALRISFIHFCFNRSQMRGCGSPADTPSPSHGALNVAENDHHGVVEPTTGKISMWQLLYNDQYSFRQKFFVNVFNGTVIVQLVLYI
jgi:hypothetical protein